MASTLDLSCRLLRLNDRYYDGRFEKDPYIGLIFVFNKPELLWNPEDRTSVEATYIVVEPIEEIV